MSLEPNFGMPYRWLPKTSQLLQLCHLHLQLDNKDPSNWSVKSARSGHWILSSDLLCTQPSAACCRFPGQVAHHRHRQEHGQKGVVPGALDPSIPEYIRHKIAGGCIGTTVLQL